GTHAHDVFLDHDRSARRPVPEDVAEASELWVNDRVVEVQRFDQQLVYAGGGSGEHLGMVVQVHEKRPHFAHRRKNVGRPAQDRGADPAIGRRLGLQPLRFPPKAVKPAVGSGNRQVRQILRPFDKMRGGQGPFGIAHRPATRGLEPRYSPPRRGKRHVVIAGDGPFRKAVLILGHGQVTCHILWTNRGARERPAEEIDGQEDALVVHTHGRPVRTLFVPEALLVSLNTLAKLAFSSHVGDGMLRWRLTAGCGAGPVGMNAGDDFMAIGRQHSVQRSGFQPDFVAGGLAWFCLLGLAYSVAKNEGGPQPSRRHSLRPEECSWALPPTLRLGFREWKHATMVL